jgi:hypothetical protein
MKKLVTSYTFDASAKTIDSADFTSLEKIQLITNVTDQIIIYNFADTSKGGTLSSTTLTLEHDTTAMDDTDKLQIFVEDGTGPGTLPTGAATAANQTTANTLLSSIDGKITAVNTGAVTISAALPAGTNAIGKLAANSGVDIGDVDVTSLPGIAGDVAAAATDSGNPVKVGGKYNTTQPTLTDGQRGNLELNSRGELKVVITNATSQAAVTAPADGATNTNNALHVMGRTQVYNGSTWDRMRGDTNGTLVEQRFSYSRKTADGQVKGSAGFVHAVTIAPTTATPTAGLLTIYDNTAESGTVIYSEWIFATTPGHTVILDVVAATGIYVSFDGTLANVSCTVSYR